MQKNRKRATLEHDLEVATQINQTLRALLNEKQSIIDKSVQQLNWLSPVRFEDLHTRLLQYGDLF